MAKLKNLLLDILWVSICDGKVCGQPGKTQGVEGTGSICFVLQVVLCIIGKMVDFDVAAHLQQLVQGLVRLTGVHAV